MTSDTKYIFSRVILLVAGALISAAGVVLFLLPNQIAPAGLSGVAVILNELLGLPVGLVIVVGNIPIQMLAYRELFGWQAVLPTVGAVAVYSLALELIPVLFELERLSDDILLNAIFGGLLTGFGGGLIYRAGGSLGGTSSLARIIRKRYGLALSTSSLFTDVFVLAAAGLVFGWEAMLYALLALFISRSISDYVLDGTGQSYTALIVSNRAGAVARVLNEVLHHRVTAWDASDSTRENHYSLLMVSIARPELHGLRQLLEEVDDGAYMTVLEAHTTYGKEFQSVASHLPLWLDQVEDSAARHVRAYDIEEITS